MLTKDIGLTRSIIDLLDNCVDGARQLRKKGNYDGLWVRLEASKETFKISDNCGGISVGITRDYAFRFGRPSEMEPTTHSIGQFGVGMKRALFKLGKMFRIESTTETSHFVVEVDVDKWKQEKEWEFEFNELQEKLPRKPSRQLGTMITVESLHPGISERFEHDSFQTGLLREIQEAHAHAMQQGLALTLDGIPIKYRPFHLLQSDQLKPGYKESSFGKGRSRVKVKLFAGIAAPNPAEAGWYIFCNGRLIIGADQTEIGGWGEGGEGTIPKYHNTFARFRGYVFFDADDASQLPWNTTKTGVDADSRYFRAVRLEMLTLMRPVIDFLRKLAEEKKAQDRNPLETAINAAKERELSKVKTHYVFKAPKAIPRVKGTGRISYYKLLDDIAKAKKALHVTTQREVGEKTFDYFFKRECE